ncbi:hypothetical protein GG344DRAFT_83659 [Lentinula edodes]|nr:hypothetical protein GG344DRAFT_83659 [Lentinula edodes]
MSLFAPSPQGPTLPASTTPTTQYRTVPHSSLTSLRLRDLSGPLRNPLKGHHLVISTTTRSFPSLVAVSVAPFELQPAPSTLQHNFPIPKPTPRPILTQLDWLMMDAARRRNSLPEMPEPGPSRLPKKRRRTVDSEEEEEDRRMEEEEDGEGDEEVEEEGEPAPKKARSEKGKERAE